MDVAGVIIGIDPHKGSHTAFAIDARERQLGRVRVPASARQAEVLVRWAARWPRRSWAIEGARGLGYLLAQQLIAADQRVLDVPPKLAARVRLLNSGQINKNDENDARSVAVAALRGHDLPVLSAEDQTMVMRVWSRRYHDLGRLRTQVICRLHTVLCELVPGGVRKELRTSKASEVVAGLVADPLSHKRNSSWHAILSPTCNASTRSAARPNAAPRGRSPPRGRRPPASTVSARSWPASCSATSATSTASDAGTTSPPTTAPPRSRSPPATG
jgi:hypothetical protein